MYDPGNISVKRLLLLSLILFIINACDREPDCPGLQYFSKIGFINATDYDLDVTLFPNPVYMTNPSMYMAANVGAGHKLTNFQMEPNPDSNCLWCFKYTLFTRDDTLLEPSEILSIVFDSIQFQVQDSMGMVFSLTPSSIMNSGNPFVTDSVWMRKQLISDMANNDCENPVEIKSCKYVISLELGSGF